MGQITRTRPVLARVAIGLGVAGLLAGACSSSSESGSTSTTMVRTSGPAQPAFDVSGVSFAEVTEPGEPVLSAGETLEEIDYSETEHLMSGTAGTYEGAANEPATATGTSTPYTTRILVRLPSEPERFSGRVVVEPLNTSAGAENDVVWKQVYETFASEGDGWIGVTERSTSPPLLVEAVPGRYDALQLQTNGLAWDILSQLGGVLKAEVPSSPLGSLDVEHVYMGGFSQSGIETGTYSSSISDGALMDDGTTVYDGFLVMARSGSLTPLESGTALAPAFEHLPLGKSSAPVVDLETQTDVQGFETDEYTSPSGAEVRRADADVEGDRYALREIPGAPHAPSISGCGDGSTFPTSSFVRAAWVALTRWVEEGEVPMQMARIDTRSIGTVSPVAVDAVGNAEGGARSPWVDVPLSTYEGNSPGGVFCQLAGLETPLDASVLATLYPDADAYLAEFEQSLDDPISAGLILESERDELIADASAKAAGRLPATAG